MTKLLKIFKNKNKNNINFNVIKGVKNYSENNIDKTLYDVYFEYHKSENPGLSDSIINSYIDLSDMSLLLNNKMVHFNYINKINKEYKKDFIKSYEELDELYSLQDFRNLEAAHLSANLMDLPEELRPNRRILKKKYNICAKEMFIPLIRRSDDKKILGILKPSIEMANIRHHDIVFLTPEIFSRSFKLQGLGFLKNSMDNLDDATPSALLDLLLKFMIDKNYTDLSMFLLNNEFYEISAVHNKRQKTIETNIPITTAKKLTEALLRRMDEDVKTTKGDISKKISYITPTLNRIFRLQLIAQSKAGMSSYQMHRTVNIRLLSDNRTIENFDRLGYKEEVADLLKKAITSFKTGCFLIAGETGSGKTTLLYSLLVFALKYYKLNFGEYIKIMTIDNPLEYDYPGIISCDIQDTKNTERELSVKEIIGAFLRSNPDWVCLTEMRQNEEFDAFFTMALRGHPAFATLHTNDCYSTLEMMMNNTTNVNPVEVKKNIRFVIHNDLVPIKCPHCNGKIYINDIKCEHCEDGTKGLVPVYELLYFNHKYGDNNGFDASKDDIMDLEKLKKEKKIIWIKKSDVIEDLNKQGIIFEEDYNKFRGINHNKIMDSYSNIFGEDK